MSIRYRLTVTGPVTRGLTDIVTARFGTASITRQSPAALVEVCCADQAALRALLTLLWDLGHEVLSVTGEEEPSCRP